MTDLIAELSLAEGLGQRFWPGCLGYLEIDHGRLSEHYAPGSDD